jgi:ribosomal protein L40E
MSQERIRAENYFCSECGAKNPSNAVFCMECGMRRDDAHPRLEKKSSNKMRSLGLTPAESLAILYPGTDGKEMLKLTMKDLVVRKIIKIDLLKKSFVVQKNGS